MLSWHHGPIAALLLGAVLIGSPAAAQTLPPFADLTHGAEEHLCSASAGTPPQGVLPGIGRADRRASALHRAAPSTNLGSSTMYLVGPPCTPADYALLSGQPLVDALAISSRTCLGSLWDFDSNVGQVITSATVELVAAQIVSDAANLAANANRLERLTYFFQIAFFHGFYEPSVTHGPATVTAAQQAMVTLGNALDLTPPTNTNLDLIEQWAISVDSTSASSMTIPVLEGILARYHGDPTLSGSFQERVIVYRVLFTIARQVGNNCSAGAASPWYGAISASLLAELQWLSLNTGYTSDDEYLVNNALYAVSRCACLDPTTVSAVHGVLTTAYQVHAQFSAPWLRAVVDLDTQFGGFLSSGVQLDMDLIRAQVRAIALPYEYVFDQGRLVFQTAISPSLATEMYEAMQEVESQFFRKCGELNAVPGDDHELLTVVIYGSPDDYATFQPFLYGLSTSNGGIFIEDWATLFTYDRTPQQSIYTLEELLRHEYVHYLDSRYLVVGSFGEPGTLYAGNRLVWYTEGLAEYLAGSSRVLGVLPRGILLEQIDNDASRMTIADVVTATYGSFTFYRYAGMMFQFLESQRPDLFVALFAAVRGNDVTVLDALYASMAADAALQSAFDLHLTAQIAALQGATTTFAEDVPTVPTPAGLPAGNGTAIRQALDAQLIAAGGVFHVWPDRFRYSYTTTTATAGEPIHVLREQLDLGLDTTLTQLSPQLANFLSTVAWCGELVAGAGSVTASYVIEGPYLPDATDVSAPAAPTGLLAEAQGGVVTCQWLANSEDDLAGYRVYRSSTSGGPYDLLTPLLVWESTFIDDEAGTGTWHYVVSAVDATGNESPTSAEVVAESVVDVLVVNGYFDPGNTGYYNAYRSTLDALGVTYVSWDPFVDGPLTASLLAGFTDGVVIWPCGYFHTGFPDQLGATRQQLLADYLAAGGGLLMSGAYVSTSLDSTSLFTTYFHLDHLQWGMDLPTLLGDPTNVVGNGLQLQLTGSGAYRSEIALTAPAQPALLYDPSSGSSPFLGTGVAACTVEGVHRLLFLAFPFADLTASSRQELVGNALAWMNPPDPCPDPFIRGDANGSGAVDIADVTTLLTYLFPGGPPPAVAAAGDVNNDGGVDISDPIFILGYLFHNGPAPSAPFPAPGC